MPTIIDETADVQMLVYSIIILKAFDDGMICTSEQSIIIIKEISKQL